MKKRLADVITAKNLAKDSQAQPMKPESIRLWLTEGKDDDKDNLATSFKKISESEQRMEVDNGPASGSTEGK